ncbi:Por secretion system C-terminal sorting domain-containing protein [Lishizhenia tianjinensis]|uniref:Por secretion system C-terminal sorting domain-containing protein n=1 Tax=Lishizhenia tianjinensis TaxID=477690 RepID=A0A1I6XC80_9FLAO|nr:T9SS type A sorting domain-containing protein [Lishizhenia tianjinensis]SFT35721.1 Por secretion system C-terminal sorting domain-containing protein [Lishizhenia tianjinensis]
MRRFLFIKQLLFALLLLPLLSWGQKITGGEYFFNTDPGIGNGTAIPSFTANDTVDINLNIDISSLSEGFHTLYVRFTDSVGQYGLYEGRKFYVIPNGQPYANTTAQLDGAEYFIDTDPGIGNGTPIPNFSPTDTLDMSLNVDLTGVSSGFHRIYIRFKDDLNNYGLYEGKSFYVIPTPQATQNYPIVEAEYFFNTDPGVGNGISITNFTPADTVNLLENINISSLATDANHRLYIRFKDANNVWGLYESREFTRLSCDLPLVDFSYTQQVCLGDANSFTNTSTVVDANSIYTWDMESDGTAEYSSSTTLNHTFSLPGTYDVKLIVENGSCVDSISHQITVNPIDSVEIAMSSCSDYTWNGNTYTSSGIYYWTGSNQYGCDSTVSLDLTILAPTTSSEVISACDNYDWNGTNYTATGVYNWTGTNTAGCDSTATLDLTILQPSSSSEVITECDTYTWNGTNYTTSGTYTWTGTNAVGCDSTATLDLTILQPTSSSEVIAACNDFDWNGTNYTTTGTYTWTGTNAVGCDSTATLDLTILQPTSSSEVIAACNDFDWNGTNYTTTGTYTWTGTNAAGCDSTATLDLTILQPTSSSEVISACNEFDWNGTNYTTTGTYTWTGTNAAGCDSIVTLDLTINPVPDLTVTNNDPTLIANQNNATYQWLDCDNGMVEVSGATSQDFIPNNNGNYAVIVEYNSCVDTSLCYTIQTIGLEELSLESIQVYPNPSEGILFLSSQQTLINVTIEILDATGKVVQNHHFETLKNQELLLPNNAGVYFIKISQTESQKVFRIVKY